MFAVTNVNGKGCPFLYCDGCGEKIREMRLAGVVFDQEVFLKNDPDLKVPVRMLCKADCLNRGEAREMPWMELGHFLMWLCGNLGVESNKKLQEQYLQAREFSEQF